ncbi:hypothetical protein BC830DRAFT_566842 [Chytriomyces sp. MP71]|nr:hypothetical protein BC830DRAFT_566842 [Chytriomyces sp. MP71]
MKVLFDVGKTHMPALALAGVVCQVPLWLNLADWSLRDMRSYSTTSPSSTSTGTSLDSGAKPPLAPFSQRVGVAGLCLGTAALFVVSAHVFRSRLVRRVCLHSTNSKIVSVETHSLLRSHRVITDNARAFRSLEFADDIADAPEVAAAAKSGPGSPRSGNAIFAVLRHAPSKKNFLLLRSGSFPDTRTFDNLFLGRTFKD